MSERASTVLADLETAHDRFRAATERLAPLSPAEADTATDACRTAEQLMDTYEERATGSGDFAGYVQFRARIDDLVDSIPADHPLRSAFEDMADAVDKRRLSSRDFDRARAALDPVHEVADVLAERAAAREEFDSAKRAVRRSLADVDRRLEELDEMLALADVDLDRSTESIEAPIARYNAAVEEEYDSYLDSTPARTVLDDRRHARWFPLVPVDPPPTPLVETLDRLETSLTIPELLEYAEYSRSKLGHYVDDPDALRTAVRTDRTYLERIDATPYRIAWPPSPALVLRHRCRELASVIGRFAADETIAALREVRLATRPPDRFDALREVAHADAALDAEQRDRLRRGEVAAERTELESVRARLDAALERELG